MAQEHRLTLIISSDSDREYDQTANLSTPSIHRTFEYDVPSQFQFDVPSQAHLKEKGVRQLEETGTRQLEEKGVTQLEEQPPRHLEVNFPGTAFFSRPEPKPGFFTKTEAMTRARKTYLKVFLSGAMIIVFMIFSVFPIYWGSLWKIPAHPLSGWLVDFDGGEVGAFFVQNIVQHSDPRITWSVKTHDQVPSPEALEYDMTEERAWMAIAVNPGASSRLNASIQDPSIPYDASLAVTAYGVEARNENAFRSLLHPAVVQTLDILFQQFTLQHTQRVASSVSATSLANIVSTSPQLVTAPLNYKFDNVRPFDQPVASAASFVGLIYILILSFYIVMIGDGARNASGLSKSLPLGALVRLRLISSMSAYFVLSLMYSLVNLAFLTDFTRHFGKSGFVVFWMLNWAGMGAVGLALEAIVTLLTVRFIPFFMLFWIICNVSVCVFPIQTLPKIYHYGYAAPFYNVSQGFRTIVFNTKNQLGLNFGILISWIIISCITMPVFQWWAMRRDRRAARV